MVGNLLLPEIQGMIQERNFTALRELFCEMPPADVAASPGELRGKDG